MKYKVLQELKDNMGRYVSGEMLSESLGVSRTAVWKHINELKREGYKISSSTKKGYLLEDTSDVLNGNELSLGLETKLLGRDIIYFDSIDSTNTYAKKIASEGCYEGTVVIADRQTAGRGRLGRQWDSRGGKGIWMSVVLRPHIPLADIQIITLAASIAVVDAIKEATGLDTGIKWPNDVVLDGKKVCGILTEVGSEIDCINYLVLGIGINVNHQAEDFSEELRNTAISLKRYADEKGSFPGSLKYEGMFNRSGIIKKILFELERNYSKINRGLISEVLEDWKKRSVTLGREVMFTTRNSDYTGRAVDITDDGRLVVQCSDGITREILSGEVKIRGMLGYV